MKKKFQSYAGAMECGCYEKNRPFHHKSRKSVYGRIMYELPINTAHTASDLGISFFEVSDMR
jgi:hypothetical protein